MLCVSGSRFVRVCSLYMFFVWCSKISAGLTNVFQLAVATFYLVYAATVVFICVTIFRLKMVSYSVVRFVCNTEVIFLKNPVIVLVSLPVYVNVVHFLFLCCVGC
jgi:hypothetical protein